MGLPKQQAHIYASAQLLPTGHSQDQSKQQTQEEKAWQATSMGQGRGDLL